MPKEFRLPSLGENVAEATIGKILVKVGDIIRKGQTVLEIETDKAVAEIPSSQEGKILEIHVKEGQKVKPGILIFTIEEITGTSTPPPEPVSTPEGGKVSPPKQERLVSPLVEKPVPLRPSSVSVVASQKATSNIPILASPSVRRLARELGVSLEEVPASDTSGKISTEDVIAYHKRKTENIAIVETEISHDMPTSESAEEIDISSSKDSWGPVVIEPMSTIRKKTAEQMMRSWSAPHVTHFDKANITQLEELREAWSKKIQSAGGRLSVLIFTLKVVAEALKKFPKFNTSIDLEKEQIIYKKYYHIGVAVDTEYGLLVPVLRNVDKKSIKELSIELPKLAEKARQRKLTLEELQGATFTISNLGGLGGTGFTPIINAPQVAILGMSRSSMEPIYQNGSFIPQLMLPLSLSYDHRVIDGAESARFVRWICNALENPWNIFLE
ncbi:MAG: dihydrolipoamide acetyltransferase family protein [Candidatus Hydrogenedens sp.]